MKKQDLKNLKKLKLNKIPVCKLQIKGGLQAAGESVFNTTCPFCEQQ